MTIIHPESYTNIANEIAESWSSMGSNYVVVAPPLTDPQYVFKKLNNISFQEDCGLDPDKLAVAYLPQVSYQTSGEFVHRVLDMWDVDIPNLGDQTDELDVLEDAIEILEEQDRIPVILLPQFHKAVEKLSWSLGARLREMEVNYGLCTVVELPVPLSRLRERWEMRPEKETFICSDFGQGHSMILLTGYQKSEVEKLAKKQGLSEEYIEPVIRWSGRLPSLVHWLIREAKHSNNINDFESSVRKGSIEQCNRFLKWLDAPESDYYKHRLSNISQGISSEIERTEVRGHDWKDVLLNKDGNMHSESIGYACINNVSGDYKETISFIAKAVSTRRVDEVELLSKGLSESCRTEERIKPLLCLLPVWRLAIGLSPNWDKIQLASKMATNQLSSSKDETAATAITVLRGWNNFSKNVCDFIRLYERNKDKGWRLSDCFSGRENDHKQASAQVVLYRLYEAGKIEDSNVALKAILEIPEQILQIYCGRKLKISVWESPEFSDEVVDQVKQLWSKGKYRVPVKKSRLAFIDLLYFGWVLMSDLDKNDRLFNEYSDIEYWNETYEIIRNAPSHSITFETKQKWVHFNEKCIELADRLTLSLTGKTGDEALPKLDAIIKTLTNKDQ